MRKDMAAFSWVPVPAPKLGPGASYCAPDLAVEGHKAALDVVGAAGVETRLASGRPRAPARCFMEEVDHGTALRHHRQGRADWQQCQPRQQQDAAALPAQP